MCLDELDELKTQGIDEGTIRDLSAGVYVGGADTVSSSVSPIGRLALTAK